MAHPAKKPKNETPEERVVRLRKLAELRNPGGVYVSREEKAATYKAQQEEQNQKLHALWSDPNRVTTHKALIGLEYAAEVLGITPAEVQWLGYRRVIPKGIKDGRFWCFERAAFERWAKKAKKDIRSKLPPDVNAARRVSGQMRYALKYEIDGQAWESLVGYTQAELRAHLEALFVAGMSWDEMHLWHIDHVRPLCTFAVSGVDCPEFKEAMKLSNLQPLWARDNIRKNAKWEQIEQ